MEAGDASGGAALRQAYIAVAGGLAEVAMVLGVEKPTDIVGHERTSAFAYVLDAELEAELGATPAAMAGLLMRRYMHEYGYELADFGGFSVNAHANGARNQLAMYRNTLRAEKFTRAPVVADPVSLFDAAPEGDGAAALIITTTERARDMVSSPVAITGSALATDFLAVQNRRDPLFLSAAAESASKAYQQAGIAPDDVDLFEVHDSFTIMTTLALEAAGFAERGQGVALAQEDVIGLAGSLPLATFGGLKARGHAGGATGVLQTVEAVLQLRGAAGENQVPGARTAMVQGLAGTGATAVTHILQTI
ncbi:MAG: hypothetical protein GYB64_09800 [Chloroflexi bacterium]|nr:hypothetical protein [Chloroflexota bacterium]